MKKEITRIAPSPTGMMHIGTARTAYFNWLLARGSDGEFILRIDDTDQDRNDESTVSVIDEGLDWLGLDYDRRFRQAERGDRYREVADELLRSGKAHHAENGAILLKGGFDASWAGYDGKLMTPSEREERMLADQPLLRADGSPIYHFASVVDDVDFGITTIIRGSDHITNTFRQAAIFDAMGADKPAFSHVGLITYGKKKMSKRDGAASLLSYRDQGFDPDALLNAMLRMGWGPGKDDKSNAIITKDRAVQMFATEGKMKSSPSEFDPVKLAWFDKKYKGMKRSNEESMSPA